MDYINMRWYLVRNMKKDSLAALHKIERAAFNYALWRCGKNNASRISAPVWWQSGLNMMAAQKKEFWQLLKNEQEIKTIDSFSKKIKEILAIEEIKPEEFFTDIMLMHRCDLLINTLHKAYQ